MASRVDSTVGIINMPSPALAEPWTNFPIGAGIIAAVVERLGLPVAILDWCEGMPDNILKLGVYGISASIPHFGLVKEASRRIRSQHPESKIVLGGPITEVQDATNQLKPYVDSVVYGEGEIGIVRFLGDLLHGDIRPEYAEEKIPNLDHTPFAARHLMSGFRHKAEKTGAVMRGVGIPGPLTTLISARGCPYYCAFCAPHSRKVRRRSAQNVKDEIRQLVEQWGIRKFKWQDDTFTAVRSWVKELSTVLQDLHGEIGPTYHRVHTRVDRFDKDIAQMLWDMGVRVMCFGIESFAPDILKRNHKGITVPQIFQAYLIAKEQGFQTAGFLIFGLPGETPDTIETTKAGLKQIRPLVDRMNLTTFVPLPGSPVWDRPEAYGVRLLHRDYDRLWINSDDYVHGYQVNAVTEGVTEETMRDMSRDLHNTFRELGYAREEWGDQQ